MQDEYKKKIREKLEKITKRKSQQSPEHVKKNPESSSKHSEGSKPDVFSTEQRKDFPESFPDELPEDFSEGLPTELTGDFSEKIPKEIFEDFPEGIPEELVDKLTEESLADEERINSGQTYRSKRKSGKKSTEKEKGISQKHFLTEDLSRIKKQNKDGKRNRKQKNQNQGNEQKRHIWQSLAGSDRESRKKVRIVAGACSAAVVVLLLIFGVSSVTRGRNSSDTGTNTEVSEISSATIRHFSFPALLSDEAAVDNEGLTVSEFTQILQDLYDHNYILVDIYNLADVTANEDGTTLYSETALDIPEGKIPFVLSERDVSYPLTKKGNGYPSRMLLDEAGNITVEYQQLDGTTVTGAYDIVPILENFIAEHPDFSYNNARGVLALTGYNGILGYRTTESLGLSQDDGNVYAQYGVFDVSKERENCAPVIEALQQKGWHFACNGNNSCSYGSEYALVQNDIDTWMENVSELIGGTDIMIFPEKTDIGPWSEYTDQNQKYLYLQSLGFRYYCIEDSVNPFWVQIRDSYVRQGIKEIDTYEDYQEIMQS